jgi:hypothetical protein
MTVAFDDESLIYAAGKHFFMDFLGYGDGAIRIHSAATGKLFA